MAWSTVTYAIFSRVAAAYVDAKPQQIKEEKHIGIKSNLLIISLSVLMRAAYVIF